VAGRKLGKGNGRPCAGTLANGQPCNSRAWKTGKLCLHCSDREAERLATAFTHWDESELMQVTVVLPAIGDLRYASREDLFALALFLRETSPNVTNPMAKAA